ncbi:histone acetyltransferase subunit NuA4-domain-containing protein [Limtongia smithiae]|uniref:histone acetyltransferase subunit NuA4-domain-containing protein n=1 Tax=Limtongia smithiae TaxID=1125753 RepID=UPI0034CF7A7F
MPDPSQLPPGGGDLGQLQTETQTAGTTQTQVPATIDKAELAAYETLRRELRDTISKRRTLEKNLAVLEDQLFKFEGAYLEDTPNGNIIKGFDAYLKSGTAGAAHGASNNSIRRKATFTDSDRLFSLSSATYLKVCYERFKLGSVVLICLYRVYRRSCWKARVKIVQRLCPPPAGRQTGERTQARPNRRGRRRGRKAARDPVLTRTVTTALRRRRYQSDCGYNSKTRSSRVCGQGLCFVLLLVVY